MTRTTLRHLGLAAGLLMLAGWASAQVYKWVDAKGVTHYSDQPPGPGEKAQTRNFEGGAGTSGLPYELAEAVRNAPVTIFTTSNCEGCDRARALLQARGVPYNEKTVTTAEDQARLRKAGGSNQVPFIVIGSRKLAGFDEGALHAALTDAAYPSSRQLPSGYAFAQATPAEPAPEPAPAVQEAAREDTPATQQKVPPKPDFQF